MFTRFFIYGATYGVKSYVFPIPACPSMTVLMSIAFPETIDDCINLTIFFPSDVEVSKSGVLSVISSPSDVASLFLKTVLPIIVVSRVFLNVLLL